MTPHVAIDGHVRSTAQTSKPRASAVDARTTRHSGYGISQRCHKRIEEVFGWIKSSAGLAKVKLRGRAREDAAFALALTAYNLIRLPKLRRHRHEPPPQGADRSNFSQVARYKDHQVPPRTTNPNSSSGERGSSTAC